MPRNCHRREQRALGQGGLRPRGRHPLYIHIVNSYVVPASREAGAEAAKREGGPGARRSQGPAR